MVCLVRSRSLMPLGAFTLALATAGCGEGTATPTGQPSSQPTVQPTVQPAASIQDDASLYRLITQTEPLSTYALFPSVDEFTTGRLNGSEAHNPIVRVRLNASAMGALQGGRLPAGGRFPDGSIVLKEIGPSAGAPPTTYAVMYRDAANRLSANGWVWAEFSPSGSVQYSVSNRGAGCAGCHQRERGQQNDLVRTFERQR